MLGLGVVRITYLDGSTYVVGLMQHRGQVIYRIGGKPYVGPNVEDFLKCAREWREKSRGELPRGAGGREEPNRYAKLLESHGWLENYKRGAKILQELSALDPNGREKLGIAAYRRERVAFVGGGAPPGGTNDVITESGFYLRVVNKKGVDLRPQSTLWEVLVCGEIWQVLPENRIIVLEVDEKDWIVLQTW